MLAVTAGMACRRMTPGDLAALSDSVAQAELVPARPYWDRRAAAHAEVIGMLGAVAADPVLGRLASLAAGWAYDLAIAAGPGADGIILGSRRRLLRHLRAGDAEAAGREMEAHLRVLRFMGRLSRGGRGGLGGTGKAGPGRQPRAPRSAA